jgi:perosamine synthetase
MYTILLPQCTPVMRDLVFQTLESRGVETRPVFYPMHQLPPYKEDSRHYPHATECASRGISLPTHEQVTEGDVAYISREVDSAVRNLGLEVSLQGFNDA